jgi:hypothetical protein
MAVDEQIRAVVTIDDRTSGPIRRIQQNLGALGGNCGLIRLGRITDRLSVSMGGWSARRRR